MIDLVKSETFAEEAAVPLKIIVGDNVAELRKIWLQKESESLEKWTNVVRSTYVDEVVLARDASNYLAL